MPPENIHIFVNKRKVDATGETMTVNAILGLIGLSGNEYDLFLVTGEGKGTKFAQDATVELKNGMHFSAIVRTVNFG